MSKVVAVMAAHPNDEVLGCGGTIARLINEGCTVHILLLADGESSRFTDVNLLTEEKLKVRNSATVQAGEIMGCASVTQLTFPDNRMDTVALLEVIKSVEAFLNEYRPEVVFTHHSGDVNFDHQTTHHADIAAYRPQPNFMVRELFFFEVPSSTEWRPPSLGELFHPNWFVDISKTLNVKLTALSAYENELRTFPHPRSLKSVEVLAKWRGTTVGVNAAESFILARKII
jgi:LmbE family N-acetylglucosaminyl deacetylase